MASRSADGKLVEKRPPNGQCRIEPWTTLIFRQTSWGRGPWMSVDSQVLGQKSDGRLFLRRIERDHSGQRLVPLSADPNRTNPLLSLTRTGRNHCEESSYPQRSSISSFYCSRFGCVATRVSVPRGTWRTFGSISLPKTLEDFAD